MKPICHLSQEPQLTFWGMMSAVSGTLERARPFGPVVAQQFRRRALQLEQDDDDTTDLLALVVEYVEVR